MIKKPNFSIFIEKLGFFIWITFNVVVDDTECEYGIGVHLCLPN
jgi:hypothetical protein